MIAKLLAANGSRRASYDDQEGDNDINIILQPSDLHDIEKERVKQIFINNTNSYNPHHQHHHLRHHNHNHYQASKGVSLETLAAIGSHNKPINNNGNKTANIIKRLARDSPATTTSSTSTTTSTTVTTTNTTAISNTNYLATDIKLAKCLLDQDYNLTVRLFIRKSALNWNFNSFTFDAMCCGRSLTELLLHLFDYYDLYKIFSLDMVNVLKCFRLLEFGYHSSNPYHNSIHAADVTQAMHCFIQERKIRKHMTHLEILSSILAAVCHDLDHPGVNQSFLVATNNPLASLYNNNSVLENHHWRFALCIFKESKLFDHFDDDVYEEMKVQLKHLILATDIARQNEYLRRFRDLTSSQHFSMKNTDDRSLVLQMALKCADLGNPCRPWLISRVWSNLICDEFYKMGRIERRLGLPLTPICQRENTSIAGIQTDFFRFIVLPLLELWHKFLESPLSDLLMTNFEHNYQRWQRANRIVQQLRRRKTVACLEPIEDNGDASFFYDDDTKSSLFHSNASLGFCSKQLFSAIKRATSDYVKSGNGKIELLRNFQFDRRIVKSPLIMNHSISNRTSATPKATVQQYHHLQKQKGSSRAKQESFVNTFDVYHCHHNLK